MDTQHDTSTPAAAPAAAPANVAVPDDLSGLPGATWSTIDYGDTITGSGAEKLASSAVAPLVAVARGYSSLLPDGVRDFVTRHFNKSTGSAEGRQVRSAVGDRDALVMPWFAPADVIEQSRVTYDVAPSALQYRPHPSNVTPDANGKKRKYLNVYGQSLVFDIHPATPAEQVGSGIGTLLLTEGLLKADSAFTAYLLANGITAAELAVTAADRDRASALARLRTLAGRIPPERRVVIAAIVGVGTWRQNPEWASINVKGGSVLIAFDGDVATKPQVWKQADDMFAFLRKSKHATPLLVDLSGVTSPDGEKVGVDDYLARGGTWVDLMRMTTDTLPPRPSSADATDGRVRMNAGAAVMEEKVTGEDGSERWQVKVPYIGRIASIDNLRAVTPSEAATGVYEHHVSARDIESECTIDIEWVDPDTGTRTTSTIEGPTIMLASKPDTWHTPRIGAAIHDDVLSLPTWPPKSDGWLEAMKGHRRDDIARNAAWSHMGWVPRPDGGTPVFLVGTQVVGASGFLSDAAAVCGVDEDELSGATRFGVDIPEDDEQARDDLRTMLRSYLACWTDPRHTAVIIAAALRPVVPLPCHSVVYFSGRSGSGKSHASAAMMAFWQAHPGAWTDKQLPGSANDTFAATENAIAKSLIWVMDDLAPSSASPQAQAEAREKVNQQIRNVHNGAAKRRMSSTMQSQKFLAPRALLVVSAEAAPIHDTSIMNRLIHVEVAKGFLVPSREPTDALDELNRTSTLVSRVTGYAIRMVARDIERRGWVKVRSDWEADAAEFSRDTAKVIEAELGRNTADATKRQSETIAEMLLGVQLLRRVISELGLDDEFDEVGQQMYEDVQLVAVEGFTETRRLDAGRLFVGRIASLLTSGRAHVRAAGVAGPPVLVGQGPGYTAAQADQLNQLLGWSLSADRDRSATAGGPAIGSLVYDKDSRPVVIFDSESAFGEVQRHFGKDGHTSKSMWDLVWATGLPSTAWSRRKFSSGKVGNTVRVSPNGMTVEGIPIGLDALLAPDEE